MVLLFKDRHSDGETVFEKARVASILDRRQGTVLSMFKPDSDLESKITSLQKMLKEKDATIVQLRGEITAMKVITIINITLCIIKYKDRGICDITCIIIQEYICVTCINFPFTISLLIIIILLLLQNQRDHINEESENVLPVN